MLTMNTNYTVDDVIEAAACLVHNVQNSFEEKCEALETVETLHLGILDQSIENESIVQTTVNLIVDEIHKQESFISNVDQVKENLENLEGTVSRLRQLKSEKEEQYSKLEKKVSELREKLRSRSKENKSIREKRNKILAYKVLSNVDFIYTTRKVKGLITKDVPETFSFNPQEMSQEEISSQLWDLILENDK